MVHARNTAAELAADTGLEAYRLSARLRKTSLHPVSTVSPAKTVGQELREARQRSGKKLDDIWLTLKIRPNFLAAIEEGRFDELPGRAFTIGYVSRYARFLQLDVENLEERLSAEIDAHGAITRERIEIEPPPGRKFPFAGIALAVVVLAAIYARENIVSFAVQTYDVVTDEGFGQRVADALTPDFGGPQTEVTAAERQVEAAGSEQILSLPFEVAAPPRVTARAEPLPSIPAIGVTQPVSLSPHLLPPIPVIDVTRAVALRFELLPPIPTIAVTQALAVRPQFLTPIPEISVTLPLSVRPEFLPPIPVVAVTEPLSVRPQFLPPIPVVAVTRMASLRPELLPLIPQLAVTQPVSLRADLEPGAIERRTRVASLFLPMPLPTEISVTPRAASLPVPTRQVRSPPEQTRQAQLPTGRRYGVQNRDSRITLRVHRPTIVAIRDARNRVFIDRRLARGDTYRVPNRGGLLLTAMDANAVEIVLDGRSAGFAGTRRAAVRDLPINPRSVANRGTRASARPQGRR